MFTGQLATMHHYHDPVLVPLSIAVAIFASYTSLHLAARLREARVARHYAWLAAASLALGGGIWSMHFVAMLAFSLPGTRISYDLSITIISLLLPIAVTAFGFAIVAHRPSRSRLVLGGVVMGIGVVAMHYSGMAAIRFEGTLRHDPLWVAVSIIIAVVAATAALWLAVQNPTRSQRWGAAVLMGVAIAGMHYSAMAGASFTLDHRVQAQAPANAIGQTTIALWVTLATLLILLLGLGAALVDRRIAEQAQKHRAALRQSGAALVDRRIAEQAQKHRAALRQSEQQFRLLVQGVTDYAIFMLDPEGHVTNWNSGAARIKGYTADEVIGRHFSLFYTEDDRNHGGPRHALTTAEKVGRFAAEGWRVRKDGSTFWANVVIQAIRDEQGGLLGFAKVTRDITETKEAREKLEQVREQLAQSQKMEAIGQLTGGVAHDFNNLLMIVLGNLDSATRMLDRGEANGDRIRRFIQNARHGAQRGASLTKSLLAFSRRQPLEPRIIDVNQAIKEVAPLLQRALGEDRPLEIVGAAGAWNIEADPAQLETALLNLAVNARDAMPQGGKVTLEAANVYVDEVYAARHADIKAGQYCLLSLTDSGVGMSPETLSHVFEPFFTTKTAGQGTGLGLSQVYGFLKQSGGHVNIYSEERQGTCIKMYFPRVYEDATGLDAIPHSPAVTGQGQRVLVVEDDTDVRQFVWETLRDLNYDVIAKESGETALEHLRTAGRVDAIITDVIMPGMNGRQLADAAKTISPETKIIFMTGYSRNAIVHNGRLDPGVILLQKPFSREELSSKINSLFSA
jgi:PAS domain S-box-containing protein